MLNVLFFMLLAFANYAQTENEVKENADKLFEKEQYVQATSLYLRLLSLNPKDPDYNFRYGTCLLFNSYKKVEAIRYLSFAVKNNTEDPRAYYFYGRALHLNYQFEDAKKYYREYLQKRGKRDDRYRVERDIEMCDNGKRLLTTFTDIIVSEKQEIDNEKFFRLYKNMETIGGDILVTSDFQSKLDKKMGHVPIVHFPPAAKAIYYASYGEDESTGKDIYIRRRLPNGTWGEPELLPGNVNTNEDEDFPYMHPSGEFLYFSSKGHNSMGGYDVFMSRYDTTTNSFKTPENVDFAISSPDDDLFYVVDEAYQNAYFASARQSQNGKLHVYRVKVARVPIQEVIIMGDFLSEVNPANKSMQVTVTSHANGKEIGKIATNKNGKYSFVFPKGGKYNYDVTVEGSEDIYKFVVDVPFLDEFRPLKQKAVHVSEDGTEMVRIVNLFNEKVEGAEAMMADVIRKRAELDVNVDQFNLDEINKDQKRKELLATIGFTNMTMAEVSNQLEELAISEKLKLDQAQQIETNLNNEIIFKASEIEALDGEIKTLLDKAEATSDPIDKHKILSQAKQLETRKLQLAREIKSLNDLRDLAIATIGGQNPNGIGKMEALENKFKSLISADNEEGALKLLAENKDAIVKTKNESPDQVVKDLIAKSTDLGQQIKVERSRQDEYEATMDQLKSQIIMHKNELAKAKKKDAESLKEQIRQKEEEIELLKDGIKTSSKKLEELNLELSVVDNNIASLQKAMLNDAQEIIPDNQVAAAVEEASDVVNEISSSTIDKELAELEREHPTLNPDYVATTDSNPIKEMVTNHSDEVLSITSDSDLTETEKTNALINSNGKAQEQVRERLEQIQAIEESDGATPELIQEKEALTIYKAELEEENNELNEQLGRIETPETNTNPSVNWRDEHQTEIANIQVDETLTEEEKANKIMASNTAAQQAVENRLNQIETAIENGGETSALVKEREALRSYQSELEKEQEATAQQIASIETPVTNDFPSKGWEEAHQNEIAAINSDSDMTEREKVNALIANNANAQKQVNNRLGQIEREIANDGETAALVHEREQLIAYKKSLEEEQGSLNTQLASLEEVDVALSPEAVINEIKRGYSDDVAEINSGTGSEKEKLQALQKLDEGLVADLEKEAEKLATALERDPSDGESEARKAIVEAIITEKREAIAAREETLAAMSEEPVTNDIAAVKTAIAQEVNPNYQEQKDFIQNSEASDFDKNKDVWELEAEQLQALETKQAAVEKALNRDPENAELTTQLEAVTALVNEQQARVEAAKTKAVGSVTVEELERIVAEADRDYKEDIASIENTNSSTKNEDLLAREKELQENLSDAIAEKEKELRRKYSVTAELEKAVYEREKEASEVRATQYENAVNVVDVVDSQAQENFVKEMRSDAFGGSDETLTATYTNVDELNAQEQMLAYYESQLDERIAATKDAIASDPENQTLPANLEWLEEEKRTVADKRRRVQISIGELETDVVQVNTQQGDRSTDPELNELQQQEAALKKELSNEDLTNEQRKELQAQLNDVVTEKTTRENVVIEQEIDAQQQQNEALDTQINKALTSDPGNEVLSNTAELNKEKQDAITAKIEAAEKARSEEEKNFLLKEAQREQEEINATVATVVADQKRAEIEEKEDIQLLSREDLEKRRRSFSVQIGDLSTAIVQTEKDIEEAKKKDQPALEDKKADLEKERTLIQSQLKVVEEQLSKIEKRAPVITAEAMETAISFNEERETSSSEEYEKYYSAAVEALEIEQQIINLEQDLNRERAALNAQLDEPGANAEDEAIQLKIQRVKELESEIDRLNVTLIQQKYAAEQLLPENTEEAMKMRNLAARGIRPIKATVVAAALIQMPTTGFAIDENPTESTYSEENPIPVGVENPSGLVYRVQIGAFARPIPQDLFKEFNPVSGEKINGTNITRYMAGFFNNSETVVDAREQIRALGYSDAFVVAYCDGERIGFGEARRRELEGTCVPKGTNEIMVEVATKTAESLGLPTTTEVQEVPEVTYNQAPGAAKADPIEIKKGLFFTVQIGVFNRPVGPEYTYGMTELMTIRLPNGQIRYASGMFDSVEEALPRRDLALQNGVKGAFVTAYFEGVRITLSEARKLLAERGTSILQSEIEKQEEVPVVETPVKVVRTDTVSTNNVVNVIPTEKRVGEQRIQIVTKKTFDEFPRDVLNRYNAEGTFFFDATDRKVKSIVYKHVDDLPRLWNFKDDIDTLYLSFDETAQDSTTILSVDVSDSVLPGGFIDWLMRFNYRKEFVRAMDKRTLFIYGIEPNKVAEVQANIRKFALEAVVVEENEQELEEAQ